ncbi:MAG: hypothetical protein COW24_05815 [Candidatus Kerfeldbacteria bacterium CG15_BIG_FIL_POST_REV_8_21_14_020_45_12]|uniref:Uncharacterized protein n=1 Tax=Candidatus Kerfeldbacteria bacterium CG15_BIG_FIL_POST_REV_8_21_14_020_45_12 TaxID=2014247 RepID=A0A2M7H272_9BACT|nr:MAG: hypothetical protein COW24_05815 [Candidatus Kerfeldbacteria bacterium CG15_BIG_FIL_POST_REV_8_21_14_020_45_12]PJA93730.1 MAG: hypothetical protein CO132_01670 [Candidatus Kerfeldbacteria bacterium CG_4_9_14_3_um_filter_45_8]
MSAVFCVLLVALLVPQARELHSSRQNLLETEAQINLLQTAVSNRETTQQDYLALEDSSTLEQSLLDEQQVISFIEDIESAAKLAGVTHSVQLQTSSREVQASLIIIPVTIQARGTWTELLQFIAELELHDWYINATQVSISNAIIDTDQQELLIQAKSFWSNP